MQAIAASRRSFFRFRSNQAGTISLTKQIEDLLQAAQKTLPAGISATNVQFRQATFIENSIGSLKESLVESALVVALVLILFLMNLRATFISLASRYSTLGPPDPDRLSGRRPDDQHDDVGRPGNCHRRARG